MLIGEVAQRSGISTRMLRHYDSIGLVCPTGRTSGGYRDYMPDDLRRLFDVEGLRTLGLSLAEAKRALDDPGFAPAELISSLIGHLRSEIAAQRRALDRLERIAAADAPGWGEVIEAVGLLNGLESGSGSRRQQAVLAHPRGAALPVDSLLSAVLAEDDPNVAGALRWSLARTGEDALPALSAGIAAADPQVRHRAVAVLVEIDGPRSTELLVGALGDDAIGVRDAAALELGRRGTAAALDALMAMIVGGRSDVEAAEVLGALVASTAVAAEIVVGRIAADLVPDRDGEVRLRLVQALAEIAGPEADAALAALVRYDDPVIAGTASAVYDRRVE